MKQRQREAEAYAAVHGIQNVLDSEVILLGRQPTRCVVRRAHEASVANEILGGLDIPHRAWFDAQAGCVCDDLRRVTAADSAQLGHCFGDVVVLSNSRDGRVLKIR